MEKANTCSTRFRTMLGGRVGRILVTTHWKVAVSHVSVLVALKLLFRVGTPAWFAPSSSSTTRQVVGKTHCRLSAIEGMVLEILLLDRTMTAFGFLTFTELGDTMMELQITTTLYMRT